jgi:putative membrane protein
VTVETQPERTALAWQRTGLGVLAVAALLAHRALERSSAAGLVGAGIAALLGLAVLGGLAPVRYRQVRGRLPGAVAAPRMAAAVTAVVVLVGIAAALATVHA